MRTLLSLFIFLLLSVFLNAQDQINYQISFENAVHHEAEITISFSDLPPQDLRIRMSRSSPGRYAVHEFAKNVYGFSAQDSEGNILSVSRPNPHEWIVSGHRGTVSISYTLFANHGDGTYSQIDETHAHLNIPATFAYAPDYADLPIEIDIHARDDLSWKVATQLKPLGGQRFYAPNLHYFMDSPIEVSNHRMESFAVGKGQDAPRIRFALHQHGEYQGFETYMKKVKAIVLDQMQVFGELPDFDFGTYTFLACYAPNVDGDGMEHRNSTVVTSVRSLSQGGQDRNIGTVAHEFFHAWNVERMRPESLVPFDFEDANLSGELWFAEGFTSYYTNLTLCRAGILSEEDYVVALGGLLSYVINSPARELFNPIEMSYQAPFVDAATSVDPVNRENTFISYYSYGNVLGLALDLSLRRMDSGKSLDGYMKLVWDTYGKKEIPYTIENLKSLLARYSDPDFAEQYFSDYVYDSQMPDFGSILKDFGIRLTQADPHRAYLGARISSQGNKWILASNPERGSALYLAGLSKGDEILSIDGQSAEVTVDTEDLISKLQPGKPVKVRYSRYGKPGTKELTPGSDPSFKTELSKEMDDTTRTRLKQWLSRG